MAGHLWLPRPLLPIPGGTPMAVARAAPALAGHLWLARPLWVMPRRDTYGSRPIGG
jgi:hypothetical protein